MNVLYIGQYTEGTTSKMRADYLKDILKPAQFIIIDTHVPFFLLNSFMRSIGFRFKYGPLITKTNQYCLEQLGVVKDCYFDLVWVDKGIFLKPSFVRLLKNKSKKLVHYTPDMSFFKNHSRYFEQAINLYDFCVTTKSAELEYYQKYISKDRVILTSQGYSKKEHLPKIEFRDKEDVIAFIGLAEESRFQTVEKLIKNGINVKVAGVGWTNFAKKHQNNPNFKYFGRGLFGDKYSEFLATSMFGLGLLSKIIPELHTTRTFEIPACGAALLTERNIETSSFFKEDEAIFYSSNEELLEKVQFYRQHKNQLELISARGLARVSNEGRDYENILKNVLKEVFK